MAEKNLTEYLNSIQHDLAILRVEMDFIIDNLLTTEQKEQLKTQTEKIKLPDFDIVIDGGSDC